MKRSDWIALGLGISVVAVVASTRRAAASNPTRAPLADLPPLASQPATPSAMVTPGQPPAQQPDLSRAYTTRLAELRQTPNATAPARAIPAGTALAVDTDAPPGWIRVRAVGELAETGYVDRDAVTGIGPAALPARTVRDTEVYAAPDRASGLVTRLPPSQTIEIGETDSTTWVRILSPAVGHAIVEDVSLDGDARLTRRVDLYAETPNPNDPTTLERVIGTLEAGTGVRRMALSADALWTQVKFQTSNARVRNGFVATSALVRAAVPARTIATRPRVANVADAAPPFSAPPLIAPPITGPSLVGQAIDGPPPPSDAVRYLTGEQLDGDPTLMQTIATVKEALDRLEVYYAREWYPANVGPARPDVPRRLRLISQYRSFDDQASIVADQIRRRAPTSDAELRAAMLESLKLRSVPGFSRHHWGTDIDVIGTIEGWQPGEQLSVLLPFFRDAAAQFGFYNPFAAGRFSEVDRPHYDPEPWHISFYPLAELLRGHWLATIQGPELDALLDRAAFAVAQKAAVPTDALRRVLASLDLPSYVRNVSPAPAPPAEVPS